MARISFESTLQLWEDESKLTFKLLSSLPEGKYDFRPDPKSRSLGELAWHLAEIEAYTGVGIENLKMDYMTKIPGFERPKEIKLLGPAYQKVHDEAFARAKKMNPNDWDKKIEFLPGQQREVSEILFHATILHIIHHRGQLSTLCRLAEGVSPGIYGPNREEMAAMRAAR